MYLLSPTVLLLVFSSTILPAIAGQAYLDETFDSEVFGEPRHYRIFLPPNYKTSEIRYPVIYYFHGHSDRYTLEKYDDGKDTVPKIARFVANNDCIVVAVDGYVEEDYEGFYGGSPWDVREEGGDYDFGKYFQEMVQHIDSSYRTLTSRQHRATSGLSMGGFFSFYVSARYPELIGSMSSFNAGPEFFTGETGSRVLWRPKDHVPCHGHTMVRLIRASGDYISQYHEETKEAYVRADDVDFEFRQDEYHRHWATSIGETFDFHMRAFQNDDLAERPAQFNYANAYPQFDVWGYQVEVEREAKGFVYLTDVEANSLRVSTRAWAPDGPPTKCSIVITTPPLYQPSEAYRVSDLCLETGETVWEDIEADADGKLILRATGAGHQFGINGPGVSPPQLVLLPVTASDRLRLRPGTALPFSLRVYNPADKPVDHVAVTLSSDYPTVDVHKHTKKIPTLQEGEIADSGDAIKVQFTAGGGYFAPTRLNVTLSADDRDSQTIPLDVLVVPDDVPRPAEIEVLDGRTATFSVFRQKGNQGGGFPIERTVTEGQGNGDGVLQPGEEATIWVRIPQGLDPKDKNHWHRTKVTSDSPWIVETQDIQEQKQREWTGAQDRTSAIRLAKETPPGTVIPLLLDNETWSFYYTPDVRYGEELLYQAFQFHKHHLHEIELTVAE